MPGARMSALPTADYTAVRHILTSPLVAARSEPYIGPEDFDWPGLLAEAETMSGGAQVLVRIAYDLWEAKGVVGIWELPRRLDRGNFERVLHALVLCRGDIPEARLEALRRVA
jgi:hypothetical protein